jgi:hypothetical protein
MSHVEIEVSPKGVNHIDVAGALEALALGDELVKK